MIGERKEDIIRVAIDSKIEDMIAKYYKAHLGDRGEVGYGKVYSQEGRQPSRYSEEVRDKLRFAAGGEPGGEVDNTGNIA